jgi:hypothetical protein
MVNAIRAEITAIIFRLVDIIIAVSFFNFFHLTLILSGCMFLPEKLERDTFHNELKFGGNISIVKSNLNVMLI